MSSFTIPVKTAFTLTWTLTDAQGKPINNAAVTVTLYAGRSAINPAGNPGTPIAPLNATPLAYMPGSAGQYSAAIPATVNPPLNGTGYMLVVDATVAGTQVYHTEQPAVIETAGSLLDLTTVDQVKNWIPGLGVPGNTGVAVAGNADDAVLQACITAWGFEFLSRTGFGDQNGDYLQSPFNSICTFNETYNGAGTSRLYLRNRPIRSVVSLFVNDIQVNPSTNNGVSGWVIDGNARSIHLRGGALGWGGSFPQMAWQAGSYRAFGGGLRFFEGIQNISVTYTAGYSTTPADIVECSNEIVHQNYRRRNWIDEESRAMAGGGGTTRYRSWDIPPRCQVIVDRYTRTL
jgi:hypothetical protein